MIGEKYTPDELNARLKFFVGMVLGLTLFGIVFVVLYSLIFVTQPMNGMSPVDNKFFELIIPIATFLTGTLSGIMLAGDDKDARLKAIDAATKSPPPSAPSPSAPRQMPIVPSSPTQINMPTSVSTPEPAPMVIAGYGGKPAPVQPAQPEI
jgi:Na+-transporting methylmalonyl-CoA/oxaloacetate decarboxylase gamma subunit